jgi:excisionase family DNA binding protein
MAREMTPAGHGQQLLLSVPEAAARLGIGRTFAWQLVHAGELRAVAVGRRRLVPVAELERFVAARLQGEGR